MDDLKLGDKVTTQISKAGSQVRYTVTGKLVAFGRVIKGKVFKGKSYAILRVPGIKEPVEVRGKVKKIN